MLANLGYYFLQLKADRKGLETIEYAIMAAIVVAVAFVGYHTLFGGVSSSMNNIGNSLNNGASIG